jgi:hypothetical protein
MTDKTRLNSAPEEEGEKETKTGRPKLDIDVSVLRNLAALQCSYSEMAFVLGCHKDTLRNRFKDIIEIGKAEGKIKLRRAMYRNATENHSAAIQIFLAKNLLGMSDQPNNADDDMILPWDNTPDKEE